MWVQESVGATVTGGQGGWRAEGIHRAGVQAQKRQQFAQEHAECACECVRVCV